MHYASTDCSRRIQRLFRVARLAPVALAPITRSESDKMLVEVLALLVLLLLLYVALISTGRPKGMPPGPTPLPIIGNLLEVIKWISKNQIQIEFAKAAKKYGNIFTVDIPGDRTVVVNSASIAREACLTKKDDFAGRPYKFTWDYLTRGSKDIAIGDFNPTLVLQRKLVHSALRNYNPHLVGNVEKEADKLSKRLKSYDGNPVDPGHDFFLTTLNVICVMVYGEHYEIDDPEFLMILDYNTKLFRLLSAINLLNIFPFMVHFPIKDSREIEYVKIKRDQLLDTKLHEHQKTYQDGVVRDLTDALIKALQEAQNEDSKVRDLITEDYVVMTMADAYSGGLETTMTSLRWYFAYMVLYPDIQAKVHAELDDVVGRDVMPKWEDKSRLPYLEATIAETLRMSAVVALAVPHKASVDSTLAGYKIPKGTTLLLNIWAMHYDENEWENPDVFDPTRFLDDEGKFVHGSGTMSYLPFGAGRRSCIGEALAKQELFIVISRLLHQFRLESAPGHPLPEKVGYMGLVHMPKSYKICIKERVLKK